MGSYIRFHKAIRTSDTHKLCTTSRHPYRRRRNMFSAVVFSKQTDCIRSFDGVIKLEPWKRRFCQFLCGGIWRGVRDQNLCSESFTKTKPCSVQSAHSWLRRVKAVRVFSCDLPSALWAERPGSLPCLFEAVTSRSGVRPFTPDLPALPPKTTWWWRTVKAEMKDMNYSWGTIQRLARDRQGVEELPCCPLRQQAWRVVIH